MGLKNILRDKRVYFDTNIFIYLLEGSEHFQDALSDLEALIANEVIKIVSCDLVYTEILPCHAGKSDKEAIEHIVEFLNAFEIFRISRQTAIQAGILRGETGMKTPDALHVASAIQNDAEIFLTNDAGICTPASIRRVLRQGGPGGPHRKAIERWRGIAPCVTRSDAVPTAPVARFRRAACAGRAARGWRRRV